MMVIGIVEWRARRVRVATTSRPRPRTARRSIPTSQERGKSAETAQWVFYGARRARAAPAARPVVLRPARDRRRRDDDLARFARAHRRAQTRAAPRSGSRSDDARRSSHAPCSARRSRWSSRRLRLRRPTRSRGRCKCGSPNSCPDGYSLHERALLARTAPAAAAGSGGAAGGGGSGGSSSAADKFIGTWSVRRAEHAHDRLHRRAPPRTMTSGLDDYFDVDRRRRRRRSTTYYYCNWDLDVDVGRHHDRHPARARPARAPDTPSAPRDHVHLARRGRSR